MDGRPNRSLGSVAVFKLFVGVRKALKCKFKCKGRSNPEVVGSIPTELKRIFSLSRVVPRLIPFTRATPSGSFMGFT